MKIRYAVGSDIGQMRKNNEDACLADLSLGIFAVADGMGGHASGEVASRMAIDLLQEALIEAGNENGSSFSEDKTAVLSSPANTLVKAIRRANQKIYQSSLENKEYRGMGTTLVALYLAQPPIAANVGDSRLYHLKGPTIEQVTEDHSLVWEQYKKGLISKEALSSSPYKNIVSRALGITPTVDVDLKELLLQPGDYLILCSDGLSDLVQDEEMKEVVHSSAGNLDRACGALIRLANYRGGKDNITVVLVHIGSL